jgi:hypothetical protein
VPAASPSCDGFSLDLETSTNARRQYTVPQSLQSCIASITFWKDCPLSQSEAIYPRSVLHVPTDLAQRTQYSNPSIQSNPSGADTPNPQTRVPQQNCPLVQSNTLCKAYTKESQIFCLSWEDSSETQKSCWLKMKGFRQRVVSRLDAQSGQE